MKVRKTPLLDFNYRRGLYPAMTEEQYYQLQAGDAVELDDETAQMLLDKSLVTQEK